MKQSRADHDAIVNDLIKRYYVQRASAGLIISEGVNISEQAKGNPFTTGLFTQKQINAWKDITKAVHDKGGVIYALLGHTGRVGALRGLRGGVTGGTLCHCSRRATFHDPRNEGVRNPS